jgi:hypothetical protein
VPVPSCQHFDSNLGLNAGLLSYIADPAVRILQLEDGEGRFLARAVVRLVSDEQGNPQLFLERIYSVNQHPEVKQEVLRAAQTKAKALGVNLYSHEAEFDCAEQEVQEPVDLFSHGSRSPAIYSDAGGGLMPDGIFAIHGAFKVNLSVSRA